MTRNAQFTIRREYQFSAAHSLPHLVGHKCQHMHGHTYGVRVEVSGSRVDGLAWVIDYSEIDAAWSPLFNILDHNNIDDVENIGITTAENLALWIWIRLSHKLPGLSRVGVSEHPGTWAFYDGEEE